MTTAAPDYASHGALIEAPDGACLFQPGDESRAFMIIRHGVVRVEPTSPEGRTMVLYRVHEGESCVLTTSCIIADRPYSGYGYAEGPVTALAIETQQFRHLLATDTGFRDMVFSSFITRVGELTDVIDALLLHRTDTRLALWLAQRGADPCEMTQMEIAQEIRIPDAEIVRAGRLARPRARSVRGSEPRGSDPLRPIESCVI